MKNIVRGNDFSLVIPVRRRVGDELVAMPLAACERIVVRLVSAFRRVELAHTVTGDDNATLRARVEGTLPLGLYALEVCGTLLGERWRSMEYEQIGVVENNAPATVPLDGALEDGEPSVLVDTQVAVYVDAPQLLPGGVWTGGVTYHRGALVSHALCCWCAVTETATEPVAGNAAWVPMLDATEIGGRVDAALDAVRQEEAERVTAEAGRVAAEDARADAERQRVVAEEGRHDAEHGRMDAEAGRVAADEERERRTEAAVAGMTDRTDAAVKAMQLAADAAVGKMEEETQAAVAGCEAAAQRAQSLRVRVDGGEIVLAMDD